MGTLDEHVGWSWDPSLYAGSAGHYALGRVPYPAELAATIAAAARLDGNGLLLDVGCGPGSLTLPLLPYVGAAIGVDADPDMIHVAARIAAERGLAGVTWRHLRAEDLPADLPNPALVTLAQSFHWMDRPRVAAILRRMLAPGGALVHVSATTHWGVREARDQEPPWDAVEDLVRRYLGPGRRAGQGVRTVELDDEDAVYAAAGFSGPVVAEIPGWGVQRTSAQVMAAVHSLSWAAPHLFGDRLAAFDADLKALLRDASPSGRFTERMPAIRVDVWR